MLSSRLLLLPALVVGLLGACNGGPASSNDAGSDAGATLDAMDAPAEAPEAPTGNGPCTIEGNNYRIYGAQIFKVSADLRLSYVVGKVANDKGLLFGTTTTGVQIGTSLIVSDANCPFCSIALPPVLTDGTVRAEPITTGVTGVKYFFDPGIPNNVVVWLGRFLLFDLAQKKEQASAGISFNGSGLFCNKVYAVTGTIMPTAYSVRFLGECGDGSGPTWATLVDTSGTANTPNTWTQTSFQTVASAKNGATKYQITRADLPLGIFADNKNVYTVDSGAFVPAPGTFQQCNPVNGIINPGAIPILNSPL